MLYNTSMTIERKTISRRKLSDEVEERLLELIKVERLKPGDALPSERELVARYDVGRPAIREAMQNLQRMGLISIKHGGRPRLAEPSMDLMIGSLDEAMRHVLIHSSSSMDHLKQARVDFESGLASTAALVRSTADIRKLENILERQAASIDQPLQFMKLDGEFHYAIAASTGNPIYELLSSAIFGWLSEFHAEQVRKPGLENVTLTEHSAILEAISAQNASTAAKAMRDHLSRANAVYSQNNHVK